MFFPGIINFVLGIISRANSKSIIFFDLILQIGSFALLALGLSKILKGNRFWSIVAISAPLVFSLAFFEDIEWAFQSAWYLIYFCILISFVSLARPKSKVWLGLSLLAVIIASLSSIQGLILGPVLAITLFLGKKRPFAYIYAGLSVILTVIYFHGFIFTKTGGPKLSLSSPIKMVAYGLVLMGSIFNSPSTSRFGFIFIEALGFIFILAALIALYLAIRNVRNDARLQPAILILLFSLGTFGMIVVGRWGFGLIQATSSRYALYTLLIPIGTLLTFAIVKPSIKQQKLITSGSWVLIVLLICQIPLAVTAGIVNERGIHHQRQVVNALVANYKTDTTSQIVTQIYPRNPKTRRVIMSAMHLLHVGVFVSPNYFYYRIEGPSTKAFNFTPLPVKVGSHKVATTSSSNGLAIASAIYHSSASVRSQFPQSASGNICPLISWLLSPLSHGKPYSQVVQKHSSDLIALANYTSCNASQG